MRCNHPFAALSNIKDPFLELLCFTSLLRIALWNLVCFYVNRIFFGFCRCGAVCHLFRLGPAPPCLSQLNVANSANCAGGGAISLLLTSSAHQSFRESPHWTPREQTKRLWPTGAPEVVRAALVARILRPCAEFEHDPDLRDEGFFAQAVALGLREGSSERS